MNINHIDLTPLRTGLTLPLSTGQIDTKWQKIQTSINEIVDKVNANTEAFEEITRDELVTLISNSEIAIGRFYLITNAQASHPECITSTVLVFGTSPNTVSENGIRFQPIPDYNSLEIWNDNLSNHAIGARCIYGSRIWVNQTGNLGGQFGSFPSNLITLSTDWIQEAVEIGVNYSLVQMDCKYDIVNDFIFSQKYKGLEIGTELVYVQGFGFSSVDYCDWGQTKKALVQEVKCLMFLNNSKLVQALKVFAPLIINNEFETIQEVAVLINKFTTFDVLPFPVIAFNKCKNIRSIANTQGITNIPSTVSEYSWVSDDETGYLEHDFNEYPLLMGETLVLGCILNQSVSLYEALINSDGNLTSGVYMQFGLEVDAVDYFTPNTDFINSHARRVADISQRTTDYNRLIVLTALDGNITSGKIYIAYKYV